MLTATILAFGTLFPIVNPISTTFVFNRLLKKESVQRRRQVALIASITAATVLLLFLALGQWILSFFGVTIYAFRVAGGLYLGKIAFQMLSKDFYKEPEDPHPRHDVAIIPIAIPLLSGPGAMAAVLVMSDAATFTGYAGVALAIVLVSTVSWLVLRHAHVIGNFLGETGASVVERVLGLIVLVIAAQFIFNGITGYVTALGLR